MSNEYYVAAEPTFLNPQTPALHRVPEPLRTYSHTLRLVTEPAPVTVLAIERASGRTVRVDENFDEAVYSRLESRVLALGATYEGEPVE